ncbi:MAG: DUF2461 domain-containing protein [Ignavibacteriales bacterium]|nr:DUF2461 domain-containing protein [Ignavibacteriales bacterium]
MRAPPIDMELYPPFDGFPGKGIEFFKRLKRNNNRTWFEKHKGEYEEFVKLPMQSLVAALRPHFAQFAPEFEVNPKKSIFRIYRDIRFSKDKTPYKTHSAAHFVLSGKPKGFLGSGYYLHIEPGETFAGAGIYMPDGEQLKKIRSHIVNASDEFLSIIKNKRFRTLFGKLDGEKLKRVPQGYDETHPMAEWLKFKQFFVGVSWGESKAYSQKFADEIARVFEASTALVRFLNDSFK